MKYVQVNYEEVNRKRNEVVNALNGEREAVAQIIAALNCLSDSWDSDTKRDFEKRVADFKSRSDKYTAKISNYAETTAKLAQQLAGIDLLNKLK